MYITFDNLYGYQEKLIPINIGIGVYVSNYNKNKIYRLVDGNVIVLENGDLNYYNNNLNTIKENIYKHNTLKIYDYLDSDESENFDNIKNLDFTIIGLVSNVLYDKGVKLYTTYTDTTDDIIVKKIFSDVYENDNLIGINILFEWFNLNDIAILSKNQIVKYTYSQAEQAHKQRRKRCIEHMIGSTRNTPLEAIIEYIYKYYSNILESNELKTNTYGVDYIHNYVEINNHNKFTTALYNDLNKDPNTFLISNYLNTTITVYTGVQDTIYNLILNTLYIR